jgi:NAD(P)-dependent dehydrogenase (short-subunit alcohol dehydrogenase family)
MESERRVVIVTGGAYGIGRGIVKYFCGRNSVAVIADINSERGGALEEEIKSAGGHAHFIRTDVREEESVKQMVARIAEQQGRIDVLCNNAGIEKYLPAENYTLDDWNAIVHTNLRGAFLCSKYALPYLRLTRGSVVNISSVQGLACEYKISVYASSKAGLLAFTRGMALDYAKDGVRVNAVCPGPIRTGMMEAFLKTQKDPEAALTAAAASVPLGRIGEPEDIAAIVYFLTSSDASFITGGSFVVDGGVLAKLAT